MEENLTYDYLHSSEDNLWSILYLTGYLTQARIDNLPDGLTALMIPNAEIREIFESGLTTAPKPGIGNNYFMLYGTATPTCSHRR